MRVLMPLPFASLIALAGVGVPTAAAQSLAPLASRSYSAPVRSSSSAASSETFRLPGLSLQADPADSIYRAARQALQRRRYLEAADLMRDLRRRYSKSTYVPDSYYWEAYALSRTGGTAEWRRAATALDEQRQKYPQAATLGDARTLWAEVSAKLASQGDANAAEDLARITAVAAAPAVPPTPPTPPVATAVSPRSAPRPPRPPRAPVARAGRGHDECDNDDDVQSAALNGLMQMDAARAMPVLKKVLARRDSGSVCLRRRAVFIVSQQATDAAPILLDVARNDPDAEVRGQAVFWLSQVNSEASVAALDSILKFSKDAEVRDKAIFALSQQDSPKAWQTLRAFAANENSPAELREKAVFWIGQRDDAASRAFLRDMYRKTTSQELKEKILFSVSQSGDAEARPWLMGVVRDPKEPMEVRKRALFWLGQQHMSGTDLGALYPQLTDPELREQLVFALSQSDDRAAMDRLIEIARTDKDPEIRKKAIFWLGQSDDPRAAGVLEKILTGEK